MPAARKADVGMDAVTAAREMTPLIVRLRDQTEADRLVARPIVESLIESRLCRLALASESSGLGLPIDEALEVYEVLAGAEASVAWLVWNNSFVCLFARYLQESARVEVFGDSTWLYAGSTRPTGRAAREGEVYRVNGRWSIVSGCELAEWILLLGVVEEDGQPRLTPSGEPEVRFAFVRRRDCTILDTWKVGGLRGTGSHDVVVSDALVPQRLTFAPHDAHTLDTPLGRVPIVATLVAWYGAQALGIAQACLDTLVELVKAKITPDPGPLPRERAEVQHGIASESAAVAAARGHLRAASRGLWTEVVAGAAPNLAGITSLWTAGHHAVAAAKQAIECAYAAGGTSSLYTSCRLERGHRDLHALLRHIIGQRFWIEDAGRVILGMDPQHPLYAL